MHPSFHTPPLLCPQRTRFFIAAVPYACPCEACLSNTSLGNPAAPASGQLGGSATKAPKACMSQRSRGSRCLLPPVLLQLCCHALVWSARAPCQNMFTSICSQKRKKLDEQHARMCNLLSSSKLRLCQPGCRRRSWRPLPRSRPAPQPAPSALPFHPGAWGPSQAAQGPLRACARQPRQPGASRKPTRAPG